MHIKRKKAILLMLCALLLLAAALPVCAATVRCPVCGSAMKRVSIDSSKAYEPTCTEGGIYYYICTNDACNESTLEKAGPLGHNYKVTATKEPTCTEAGYEKLRCSRCGKTATRTLEPTGHDYAATVTEPTCTEDGFTTYVCSRCEDTYTEAGAPAPGHDLTVTEVPATCTEDGHRDTVCSRCDYIDTEVLPAGDHAFTETVTQAASCTEAGTLTRVCGNCGATETESIPATGHSYGAWTAVEAAGPFREGKEERVCGACGDRETRAIPKTGGAGWIIAGGAAGTVAVAGAAAAVLRASAKRRAVKELAKRAGVAPSVMMKRILLCLAPTKENEIFEKRLKKVLCLTLFKAPYGNSGALIEAIGRRKPDIVIASAASRLEAETLLRTLHAHDEGLNITLLGEEGMPPAALDELRQSKAAYSTAMHTDGTAGKIVRLAMVAYRFDMSGADHLANITILTDMLGLNLVTTLINVYAVKDDIGEIVERHEIQSCSTAADLINDIGELFGLELLADLANKVRIGIDQLTRNIRLDKDTKNLKNAGSADGPSAGA